MQISLRTSAIAVAAIAFSALCGCQGYEAEGDDAAEDVGEVEQALGTTLPISANYTTGQVALNGKKYYNFAMTKYSVYTVTMVPGYTNQDPDLYTSNSSAISMNNYQCRPFLGKGKVETCIFQAPFTGTNYIMINGATAANFGIRVTSP